MAKQHYFLPSGSTPTVHPVRLGAGSGAANNLSTADEGKLIKLVAESRYDLAAVGDPIEGVIYAVEVANSQGFTIGGRVNEGQIFAIADGLQATPGTGALAVGDYVVAGTITAKGTRLVSFPKVCKATDQPGAAVTAADNLVASINAALAKISAGANIGRHGWRVMSLTAVGTGAVGTQVVLERV